MHCNQENAFNVSFWWMRGRKFCLIQWLQARCSGFKCIRVTPSSRAHPSTLSASLCPSHSTCCLPNERGNHKIWRQIFHILCMTNWYGHGDCATSGQSIAPVLVGEELSSATVWKTCGQQRSGKCRQEPPPPPRRAFKTFAAKRRHAGGTS